MTEPTEQRKGHLLRWSIVVALVTIGLWIGSNLLADHLQHGGYPVCRYVAVGMDCPLSGPTTTVP